MSCKMLEKCKTCRCRKQGSGLSDHIAVPRPTERVIERQIVEIARGCEPCDKEAAHADEKS